MRLLESRPPGQLRLHLLKLFPGYDGRVVVPQAEGSLPPVVGDLPVGEVIGGPELLLDQVAAVLLIAQQAEHHGGGPGPAGPEGGRDPQLGQFPGDGVGPLLLLQKFAVDQADDLRLPRVHGQLSGREGIAVDGVVPKDDPPLHRLELAPAGALRDLPALLLGHAGHDGETELPVVVPGCRCCR